MKKTLIITGIVVLGLLLVLASVRHYTKSFSPEKSESYTAGGFDVKVQYNRPSKKGRVIFGGLVPYGKVWRTGANEASVFTTGEDLHFGDNVLKAGSYSLWTLPNEQDWKVIFNSETGQWGINYNGEANRDPKNDVLTLDVKPVVQEKQFEQFTINIEKHEENLALVLMWDQTIVTLPFSK